LSSANHWLSGSVPSVRSQLRAQLREMGESRIGMFLTGFAMVFTPFFHVQNSIK
jgi:hypothetical protein